MNVEKLKRKSSVDHSVLGTSRKNKRLLYGKTFLIDSIDKMVRSKIERLINLYGGKLLKSLKKNSDFLISDAKNNTKIQDNSSGTSNCRSDLKTNMVPYSKYKNSADLIKKATLLNIRILSSKQFQHWLKSLLKKKKTHPTDRVASVLRGKVSLKIEPMDQGQCPVFEFIPKWPDLGDTLCKKNSKMPVQCKFSEDDKSNNEYSSDQYSTSEIGGMCELCDMPFMNYKEHINTKKHIRESQDENKFHELDELINEKPLNIIFNQLSPKKKKNKDQNLILESTSVENCLENTVITILGSDSEGNKQKVPCSFDDKNYSIFKQQASTSSKRKYCSTTNISFVPQKRPSKLHTSDDEISFHKKTKRKHKIIQKPRSKDIYKVEVVNSKPSSSQNYLNNDRAEYDKPPVIIRLKRVQYSKSKNQSSDVESNVSVSSTDNEVDDKEDLKTSSPAQNYIRVVRKQSLSNKTEKVSSKGFSDHHIFKFEQPELYQNTNSINYYPTYNRLSNIGYSINIQEKVAELERLKCTLSFRESIKYISNMQPQQIGEWFYNIPKRIEDDLSFESSVLVPLTEISKKKL